MSNLRLSALLAGLALYAAALIFPAIIFKPDAWSNPKRFECEYAARDDVQCEAFRFGGDGNFICGQLDANDSRWTFVDKAKILEYCKGWDLPVGGSLRGYEVLLTGIVGAFYGTFAWCANALMFSAFLLQLLEHRRAGMVASAAAVAIGLQAYALDAIPVDIPTMVSSHLRIVDHLGVGFYLWMASLVTFSAYFILKRATPLGQR